jgi:hypothetical protein
MISGKKQFEYERKLRKINSQNRLKAYLNQGISDYILKGEQESIALKKRYMWEYRIRDKFKIGG